MVCFEHEIIDAVVISFKLPSLTLRNGFCLKDGLVVSIALKSLLYILLHSLLIPLYVKHQKQARTEPGPQEKE